MSCSHILQTICIAEPVCCSRRGDSPRRAPSSRCILARGRRAGSDSHNSTVAGDDWPPGRPVFTGGSGEEQQRSSLSKHGSREALGTVCTEVDLCVGQGLQTGHPGHDPSAGGLHTESRIKRGPDVPTAEISAFTCKQGKPGEPGSDGAHGPKGSRVSLYCLCHPALVHQVLSEVFFL